MAGFIGFRATQRPPEIKLTKAISEQQTANSTVKRDHISETDARPSEVKTVAQTEADEVSDEVSEKDIDDFLAWLDEL